MDQWLWLLIAIGAAVVLAAVILLTRKKERTSEDYALLTLGPTLVVLGIIFGDDPLIGYSLELGFCYRSSVQSRAGARE
jgi:drug/metabolite transporter (DMT)-like permease